MHNVNCLANAKLIFILKPSWECSENITWGTETCRYERECEVVRDMRFQRDLLLKILKTQVDQEDRR